MSVLPSVNDDHRVIEMVTEYDVMNKGEQTVGEIMTRACISITMGTDLEEVSHILVHERIKRLPCLSKADYLALLAASTWSGRWLCIGCGLCEEMMLSEEHPERCPRW